MTMPISDADIARMRNYCGSAIVGTWKFPLRNDDHYPFNLLGVAETGYVFAKFDDQGCGRFCAAARTDLPACLAEIERLTEENATLQSEIEEILNRIESPKCPRSMSKDELFDWLKNSGSAQQIAMEHWPVCILFAELIGLVSK